MSAWIRAAHRWLSIFFTLAVLGNFAAVAIGKETTWVGLVALVPLFLLMFSGLYMFALPYVARWRGGRRAAVQA